MSIIWTLDQADSMSSTTTIDQLRMGHDAWVREPFDGERERRRDLNSLMAKRYEGLGSPKAHRIRSVCPEIRFIHFYCGAMTMGWTFSKRGEGCTVIVDINDFQSGNKDRG